MPTLTDLNGMYINGAQVPAVYLNGVRHPIGVVQRYFTRIDVSTKGFSLPSSIPLGSSSSVVRVRFAFVGSLSARTRPAFSSSTYIELDRFSNTIDFRYGNSGPSVDLVAHEALYDNGSIVEYELVYDGVNAEGFINGVSQGSSPEAPGSEQIDTIFATGSSGSSVIYPLSVEAWSETTDTSLEPDFRCLFDSDGTGTEEVDVIGGNNPQRVGLASSDTELFTFDSSSNSWKNSDESITLPVTY